MKIESNILPLPIDNIDTDQIIPAQFLKQVDKKGYGKNLFYSWRYQADGTENEAFILNHAERKAATVLLAGNNFGCGSSREHAAWSIADYGIKAVLSTQFADIFKGNAYNNGILPVELSQKDADALMQASMENPELTIQIDLEAQQVTCEAINLNATFDIHPFKKHCLMEGVDETEYLINIRKDIQTFEKEHRQLAQL